MPSLLNHRISYLETTNDEIQQQLDDLLETARRNEEKFLWLRNLILELIDVQDSAELDYTLGTECCGRSNVDDARFYVWGIKANGSFNHIFDASQLGAMELRLGSLKSSVCENLRPHEYRSLFGRETMDTASVALVPITSPSLRGVLAIGSRDPLCFTLERSMLFLEFLGDVIGKVARRAFK